MAESKENALVAYDPDCLRKRSNWGKSGKNYRFDTPEFDPAAFLETMRSQSPKLYSLLTKIDLLDARDMAKDGRRYKHFIFSDVRANSAGAKMLASALIARGWTLGYKAARLANKGDGPAADDKKPKKKKYGKIELLSADTLHKTRYENFYLLASTGVYDQPISVATKKSILQRFNSRPDNVHGEQARIIVMDSGFKEGIDLFDIRYVHIFEPSVTAADQQQIIGRGTRLCGQKGLKFHPTLGWPLYVFIYDVAIPEELRGMFLDQATLFDAYLRAMNMDVRLYRFANDLEKVISFGAVDYDLNRNIHMFRSGTATQGTASGSHGNRERRMTVGGAKTRIVKRADGSTKTFIIHDEIPPLVVEGVTQQLGHNAMRNMIKRDFAEYAWTEVKMENGCAVSDADSVPDFAKKVGQNGGPSANSPVIQFTPTQNFVRHYFTPQCAVKGMLLWHGVGTGKTCSAIATATTSFEPQGYTILWVTRTTLKNDIWKNMFDQVCNAQFQQKMAESGYVLPTDPKARMRALSKAWRIRPMSYKQFSNLVSKQNQMYKTLVKINGEADPLRKTLLVIDEAHKLYGGGDLSSLERPDMDALHRSIMHSYRVSGRDSVRLLLMTATPITQSPMEIIQLLNLCKPADAQIPSGFDAFSQDYLNDVGGFTTEGRRQFLDNIAGYISYLNREKDARQFAQISIERIEPVLVKNVAEVERFDKRLARETLGKEVVALKNKVLEETAKIDADLLDVDSGRFAFLKSTCDEVEPAPLKKACVKVANRNIRELVSEIKVHTKKLREDIKVIRGEVKNKNLFRRETLKRISDTLAAEPVEYAKFQESLYYQLKTKCAKRVKATGAGAGAGAGAGDEAFAMHPQVQELTEQLATYDDRIARLNADLDGEMAVHKARVAQIRTMMRSGQLNDLEKSTLKLSLKDIRKTAKKTKRDLMKIVSGETKTLNTSRKEVAKRRKKVYARLRKTLKAALKDEAAKEKEEARAAKKLRKTLRKEGRIRDEMKNELLVDLVGKYEKKIVREVEDGRLGILAKAAAKAEEKELKAEVKAELKKMKADAKADAREKKAREKAVVKAQEKEKKAVEKALAKRERETRRAQEKEEKRAAKIAARKTKKNLG
jgi:hypothetical protein